MNKLIKINSALVSKKSSDLDEYLKPMSRDILLFTTKVANTYRLKDKKPLFQLKVGERLFFKRSESKYEDNLIEMYNNSNEIVGYVSEADSPIFARLMDAGKMLFAIIKSISLTTNVPLIEIDIFLQDF